MLMAISWRFKVPVKSSLVNWLPPALRWGRLWSVLKILGPAVARERFLERLDTKLGAERVRQPPCQHSAAHPIQCAEAASAVGFKVAGAFRRPGAASERLRSITTN
jgi:hypothetical protein